MKIGITVPQFRAAPDDALAAARAADDDERVEGVFLFDHLWAIGRPGQPALACWPLLGALAATTGRVVLGTLVARVGLLPEAVLAHHFETAARIVGPARLVAGLGTGDRLSRPENDAYGIPFPPFAERIEHLRSLVRRVRGELGIETWVGGTSPRLRALAAEDADALNLWGVDPREVAEAVASGPRPRRVTWGGVVPADPAATSDLLGRLADAGADWAVCAPPYAPGRPPAEAIAAVVEATSLT